ncbi:peptidoglycan DD-metalloendopeptidase family protein [Bordetella bronchiseptica]|uniref:peptidoglycan DD-metalloendopeptidase family protein n=1 Tax=Bordetella bronchiseptica TaxID=518 RepID=UPI0009280C91|nr:peptidoglycan DD-metalloendopeptidase family protein [Bordetella bronchiseptica]SHR53134.1 peptidase M23B [Mycobacteroides abscessus subsp. abscessus]
MPRIACSRQPSEPSAAWGRPWRPLRALLAALALALLAACGSTSGGSGGAFYRVQSGDTLHSIARKHGQSVGDLVRWNKLANANRIEKGQLLRVKPPGTGGSASPPPRAASGKSDGQAPAKPAAPIRGITLIWPADGKVTRQFNGSSVLGITIANSAGTSVVAAAGGTVAYASNGLRGYGNLVIVRHDGSFLTIYAHNRKLLVKQGQRVSQGQRIAEMGDTDSSQVNLYFELRRDGKAVNPAGALPRR